MYMGESNFIPVVQMQNKAKQIVPVTDTIFTRKNLELLAISLTIVVAVLTIREKLRKRK